ncbi:hypothetical protein VRZ08_05595 [Rhodopseudomonas sp. G2_2311]|uniref:hypothetical protein n=1 Tax=Rhodopseudomonas sp. G2_2311 TaxID=3114287 RepID=UPI0039C6173A
MATRRQHIRNTRAVLEAGTPLEGEYPFDQTLKALRIGDGATQGGYLQKRWGYAYVVSPPQIAGDQNDYSPTDLAIAELLDLTSDAKRTITGLAGGAAGRRLTIRNRGSFDITLSTTSTASLASNRFLFERDLVLRPRGSVELQYSVADGRWMRAGGNEKLAYITEELLLTGTISPAQLTANQNDYAPSNIALATTLRLTSDASRNITGIADARDGVVKVIVNVGTNPIVLKAGDTNSLAVNRFDFASDITLQGRQSATIRYDATDGRWKLLSQTAGSAVSAGAVTAQTLSASALGMSMVNGVLVATASAGTLTIAIKTMAGGDPTSADPVHIIFRSATAADGALTVLSLTAATSLSVSSGSSLGVVATSTPVKVWVVGFNDGGTFRLGVINCLNGVDIYALSAWDTASSTAEGGAGAADSAQTFYTGAAVTSKAFVTLGYLTWEAGLAAVGTWISPGRVRLFAADVPLPGSTVSYAAQVASGLAYAATQMSYTTSTPQITEGDQYLAKTVVPTSAAHLLDVEMGMALSSSTVNNVVMALFQDSITNALAASEVDNVTANAPVRMHIRACFLAKTASPTTLKGRAGSHFASTVTFNGQSSGAKLGGTSNSYLIVREIAT